LPSPLVKAEATVAPVKARNSTLTLLILVLSPASETLPLTEKVVEMVGFGRVGGNGGFCAEASCAKKHNRLIRKSVGRAKPEDRRIVHRLTDCG
jgi:hypothetical protein